MDLGSIFLILALFIVVVLFISRPFFEKAPRVEDVEAVRTDHDLSSLMAERDRVLNALQELDFDYALGKIPEEDYPEQRARLLEYGAGVLRQLDEMQAVQANDSAEDRLEAVIAARRADARSAGRPGMQPAAAQAGASGSAVATADDEIEAIIANRRRDRQEKSGGFCPQCGGAVQKSDRFCPKCGTTLGKD